MKHLSIVMESPDPGDLAGMRTAGRGLGVPVVECSDARDWQTVTGGTPAPVFALGPWRGPKAYDLSTFEFPDRMVLITGLTIGDDDTEWLTGSLFIEQSNWAETRLSQTTAGVIAMWEFHKQRGV